jgi:hypothetical protein
MGVLRPLEQRERHLVLDGGLRRAREGRHVLPAPPRRGLTRRRRGGAPGATLIAVSAVFVIVSLAVYAAGLVLLAWEGRRDLAILLAAAGGVALSIATLP